MFYSAYKRPKTKAVPAGDKFENSYEISIDENGHKVLEKSPIRENVYDKIQESLEETKIENIIRRATGGDITALNVSNASYFDATGAPTTLAEAQQLIIDATKDFYKLPIEIREKFDHSPEKFITEYGSESWINIMFPEQKQPDNKNTSPEDAGGKENG